MEKVFDNTCFRIGEVYWSGKNPPRKGVVPDGYIWQSIQNRKGKIVGHKLVPIPDPNGPPNFPDGQTPTTAINSYRVDPDRMRRAWDAAGGDENPPLKGAKDS